MVEGPNYGVFYSPQPVPPLSLAVAISPALTPGDAWYAGHQGQVDPNSNGARRFCTGAQLSQFRQDAEKHEGLVPGWPRSHVAALTAAMQQSNFNAVIDSLVVHIDVAEARLPGGPKQAFIDSAYRLQRGFSTYLNTFPDNLLVDSLARVPISCAFKF